MAVYLESDLMEQKKGIQTLQKESKSFRNMVNKEIEAPRVDEDTKELVQRRTEAIDLAIELIELQLQNKQEQNSLSNEISRNYNRKERYYK